jgi:hypothetical protein
VWPTHWSPATAHAGYTASAAVYLPAAQTAGLSITITSGIATVFAGHPDDADHRVLAILEAGETYTVGTMGMDEVLSVETAVPGTPFTFELDGGGGASVPGG